MEIKVHYISKLINSIAVRNVSLKRLEFNHYK